MICPHCNSEKLHVYRVFQKSKKNFRHIVCDSCKSTFKSIEYIPTDWDYEKLYKSITKDLHSLVHKYKNNYNNEGEW